MSNEWNKRIAHVCMCVCTLQDRHTPLSVYLTVFFPHKYPVLPLGILSLSVSLPHQESRTERVCAVGVNLLNLCIGLQSPRGGRTTTPSFGMWGKPSDKMHKLVYVLTKQPARIHASTVFKKTNKQTVKLHILKPACGSFWCKFAISRKLVHSFKTTIKFLCW